MKDWMVYAVGVVALVGIAIVLMTRPAVAPHAMDTVEEVQDVDLDEASGVSGQQDRPSENTIVEATVMPQTSIEPIAETVEATLVTNKGEVDLLLHGEAAPVTVGNFVALAQDGFYDGTSFHRVIEGFMIQGGDPLSKDMSVRAQHGTGGPGYVFEDEINDRPLVRGSLAMANAGPGTNGSQFFIVTVEEVPWLDGHHTNFGEVVNGMDVVDAISKVEVDGRDNPVEPVVVQEVRITRPGS